MLDIIGTIYTAGTYDDQGEVITPPEPISGWHVNAVCSIPAFEPYTIHPETPSRTFGDVAHTVFLQFQDRAEWLSLGIEYTDDEGNQAFDTSALQAELDKRRWRKTADCSRLQGMLALEESGLLTTIENWIADPATPIVAKLAWNEAYRFSRNSALFDAFAGEFGLTPEQVDDLFVLAQSKSV